MTPKEAYLLLPNPFENNKWYKLDNGLEIMAVYSKRYRKSFMYCRKLGKYNYKDYEGNILDIRPCWKVYKENTKGQWVYDNFYDLEKDVC